MLATWWNETLLPWMPTLLGVGLWMGFWLFAVNWTKVWPTLAVGGWAAGVLVVLISALVWSRLSPEPCNCFGILSLPNFTGKLGSVSCLACLALFSGCLQDVVGVKPVEVSVEPPAHQPHGHGHDHGHGHH